MAFIVGIIVNSLLISIPIGATLGTLFGIRPFEGDRVPIPEDLNQLVEQSACEDFHLFVQNKAGTNFTINSNEILPDPASTLCLSMTTFENGTYPTNDTVPPFSITWSYPFAIANASVPANESKPLIHAFPQVTFADPLTPVALNDISAFELGFEWTMGIGNDNAPSTSDLRLESEEVNSTVALDMFLDSDSTVAGNASQAAFEMIIFFAKYGLEDPVGFGNGSTIVTTTTLDGTDYNLFTGKNDIDQNVFTWVAKQPVTEFNSDIMPLFTSIINLPKTKKNLNVDVPTFTTYLGTAGFGTQAFNAIGNVTFFVPKFSLDIQSFGS